MGNWFSDKYAEGTVGHRFYAGCQNVDTVESLAAEHARELFGAPHAYVQPHSGIDANLVAFWAVLAQRVELPALQKAGVRHVNDLTDADWATLRRALGDQRMLGMSLDAGGHLTHGFRPNITGKMFDQSSYGTDPATGLLDYAAVRARAQEFRPLILMAGYSAYPRRVNFAAMREIADEVGATLVVDMAHFAGLVAGKVLHRRLRPGAARPHRHHHHPQVAARPARRLGAVPSRSSPTPVDRGCPMVLGGPLPHVMAAKAVAFAEARQPAFADYAQADRRQRRRPRRGADAARRAAGHRRHRQPPRAARRQQLRPHRPAGRVGAARRRHRHQPQRHPGRPERRLVHLRRPHRHARR